MAKKVVEEATEVAIDAVRLQRDAVINESVDLFYNLAVIWHELEISPAEVWAEMVASLLISATLTSSVPIPKNRCNARRTGFGVLTRSQSSTIWPHRIGKKMGIAVAPTHGKDDRKADAVGCR
jgi:hypothetical protein